MAKTKRISYFERMSTPYVMKPVDYTMPYEVYEDEQTVVDGVVVRKSVAKLVNPKEFHKDVKCTDFALENVIAAGAVDMLKPVMLHDAGLDTVDKIDGTLNEIMDQIDANVAVSAPKNNDVE